MSKIDTCEVCKSVIDGELTDEILYCNCCNKWLCNLCFFVGEHQDRHAKWLKDLSDKLNKPPKDPVETVEEESKRIQEYSKEHK